MKLRFLQFKSNLCYTNLFSFFNCLPTEKRLLNELSVPIRQGQRWINGAEYTMSCVFMLVSVSMCAPVPACLHKTKMSPSSIDDPCPKRLSHTSNVNTHLIRLCVLPFFLAYVSHENSQMIRSNMSCWNWSLLFCLQVFHLKSNLWIKLHHSFHMKQLTWDLGAQKQLLQL